MTELRRIISLIILISLSFTNYSKAQNENINILFQKFLKVYNSGDIVNSNEILLSIVNSKTAIPDWYKSIIYNNLCAINTMMGQYDNALEYNEKAETLMKGKQRESGDFADMFINRASIYTIQKSYSPAIDYYEKAIRIYNKLNERDNKNLFQSISAAYLNLGIVYYELNNYKTASDYFNKSVEFKCKHKLT